MKDSKLISMLSHFSRREMSRFRDFVFSPYFNKHSEVRKLVDFLSHIFPNFDESSCDRYRIFQHLFPDEAHDQNRLAVLFTYAQRLVEQFLAIEHYQEAPQKLDRQLGFLQRLRQRQNYEPYEPGLGHLRRQVEDLPHRDGTYHYWRYKVASEADDYHNQIERRKKDHSIEEKQQHLDYFFLAEKLKGACEMRARSRIMSVDYELKLVEEALTEVGKHPDRYEEVPAVLLYYKIHLMITSPGDANYFDALESLRKYEEQFNLPELQNLYNYFQNYCIANINQGRQEFLMQIFQLYQSQLKQGLLLQDGWLSEWHYKNIVTTGIRLRELDWVRQFIEEYRERLPVDARENAYRFNLASYYYAAGAYDEVLGLLTQVEYSDQRYQMGAKALLLRTYYDLGEFSLLFSLADSFRQYLHRNQLLADAGRQGYSNLFKLTRRAAQIRDAMDYSKPERLIRQVQQLRSLLDRSSTIFNKAWVEEKVADLERELSMSKTLQ